MSAVITDMFAGASPQRHTTAQINQTIVFKYEHSDWTSGFVARVVCVGEGPLDVILSTSQSLNATLVWRSFIFEIAFSFTIYPLFFFPSFLDSLCRCRCWAIHIRRIPLRLSSHVLLIRTLAQQQVLLSGFFFVAGEVLHRRGFSKYRGNEKARYSASRLQWPLSFRHHHLLRHGSLIGDGCVHVWHQHWAGSQSGGWYALTQTLSRLQHFECENPLILTVDFIDIVAEEMKLVPNTTATYPMPLDSAVHFGIFSFENSSYVVFKGVLWWTHSIWNVWADCELLHNTRCSYNHRYLDRFESFGCFFGFQIHRHLFLWLFACWSTFTSDKCELVSIHMELLEMNYGSSNYFGSLSSTIGVINKTLVCTMDPILGCLFDCISFSWRTLVS